MPIRKTCILAVDDDVHILRLMTRILGAAGHQVRTAVNGEDALKMFDEEETPDLVLLDVRMPGMDGYTVCRRIREFSQIPIIMVSAKGSDEEKVEGLDAGADDYVTKPFSSSELEARVRAVLRRTILWDERPEPSFHSDDLVVEFALHKVTQGGQDVDLTATEYRLLSYLARNAGRVITLDQLLETVWGEEYVGEYHILRVNVGRLRQKLGDGSREPRFIVTKFGIGYMFLKPG